MAYFSKYDYDACLNEARKYTTLQDFRKYSPNYSRASEYRGWINDFTWLENTIKPKGYWTKERCYEEALKHDNVRSFHDRSGGAYKNAADNGWIEDYTWLKREVPKKGSYTKEVCYNEAKKYTDYGKFRIISRRHYEHAKKNGWLKDYTWLIRKNKPFRYWNRETCYEEAKKFHTYQEFRDKSYYQYQLSKENDWLKDYTWLENKNYTELDEICDNVYVYLFEEQKSAYIGRTKHLKQRHRQHTKYTKSDTVYKFMKKYGITEIEMIILEENISLKEGLEKEDYWKKYYAKLGYKIINRADTGLISGSVGGRGCNRWTKEEAIVESKKYKTFAEFNRESSSAYRYLKNIKALKECTWLEETSHQWTKEECFEIALKYDNQYDFIKNDRKCYMCAKHHGWTEEYAWLTNTKFSATEEECYNEAKKYNTLYDFKKYSYKFFTFSDRRGWINQYDWLSRKRHNWSYEECYSDARKFKSVKEYSSNEHTSYDKARTSGWIIDFVWLEGCPSCNITEEECYELAKKYNRCSDFYKYHPKEYWYAKNKGWINKFKLWEPKIRWTKENLIEESKKYKFRKEMQIKSPGAYNAAYNKGLLDELFPKEVSSL